MSKEITIESQIKTVEREIAFRERVYPKRIADGKMTQKDSDFHIGQMQAVLKTLHRALAAGW